VVAAATTIDAGQLASLIAVCVSAAAAAISSLIATRTLVRSRRSSGVSQLHAFIVAWDAPAMQGMRHRAAADQLAPSPEFNRDAFDILNFFETIGYMVHDIRVIPKRACWLAFSDTLICYVGALRAWIDEFQHSDPTAYASLLRLETQMLTMTVKELRRLRSDAGDGRPTQDEIVAFLETERELPNNRDAVATATTVVSMPPLTLREGGWRWLRRRTPDPA
jgi:hypothetical protein